MIIEQLPNLQANVENIKKYPDSSSYKNMKEMLNDPLLKVKLCRFVTIAKEFEVFLKKFQDGRPIASFLFEALESIINSLSKRFIKLCAMKLVNSSKTEASHV